MAKEFDFNDFINSCVKKKLAGHTIYIKDGIRYVDQESILVVDTEIEYKDVIFTMDKYMIALKEHLKYTQIDLAKELGLTRKAISKYKRETNPTTKTISTLRNTLYDLCKRRTEGKLFLSMSTDEMFFKKI